MSKKLSPRALTALAKQAEGSNVVPLLTNEGEPEIQIKKLVSIRDLVNATHTVLHNSFDGDTYDPICCEVSMTNEIVKAYTNIAAHKDDLQFYDFIRQSNILDRILEESDQVHLLISITEEMIEEKRESIKRQSGIEGQLSKLVEKANTLVESMNPETLKKLAKSLNTVSPDILNSPAVAAMFGENTGGAEVADLPVSGSGDDGDV